MPTPPSARAGAISRKSAKGSRKAVRTCSRATAPLRVADGALVIDSTHLSVAEVLRLICTRLPPDYLARQ